MNLREGPVQKTRVNEQIQAQELRLLDENGEMFGVMSAARAREIAREKGLDLVEVGPHFLPPLCTLMDYDLYIDRQAREWGKKP